MEISDNNRTRGVIIFALAAILVILFAIELWASPSDWGRSLWISIKLAIASGVAFFAFQNIFYRRIVKIDADHVEVLVLGLGSRISARREARSAFAGLQLTWIYSRVPKLPPRLEMRLKHDRPEWNVDLLTQNIGETPEAFVTRARPLQSQSGLPVVVDESGLWTPAPV